MSKLPEYILDRIFDAPRAMVWQAWTDPELLAHHFIRDAIVAALADAEEAFRMIRLRYESQLSSQLEVLDAQVALTAARMEEVSSRYDYLTAWDNLLRAMGTVQEIDS